MIKRDGLDVAEDEIQALPASFGPGPDVSDILHRPGVLGSKNCKGTPGLVELAGDEPVAEEKAAVGKRTTGPHPRDVKRRDLAVSRGMHRHR